MAGQLKTGTRQRFQKTAKSWRIACGTDATERAARRENQKLAASPSEMPDTLLPNT